jgi:hypothetical protein
MDSVIDIRKNETAFWEAVYELEKSKLQSVYLPQYEWMLEDLGFDPKDIAVTYDHHGITLYFNQQLSQPIIDAFRNKGFRVIINKI